MEDAAGGPVAVGTVTTTRTGPAPVVAAPNADVGPGQVLDAGDAFGGVGSVLAGSGHGDAPEGSVLSGDTPYSGRLFTDPARFPCYRLGMCGAGAVGVVTSPAAVGSDDTGEYRSPRRRDGGPAACASTGP